IYSDFPIPDLDSALPADRRGLRADRLRDAVHQCLQRIGARREPSLSRGGMRYAERHGRSARYVPIDDRSQIRLDRDDPPQTGDPERHHEEDRREDRPFENREAALGGVLPRESHLRHREITTFLPNDETIIDARLDVSARSVTVIISNEIDRVL